MRGRIIGLIVLCAAVSLGFGIDSALVQKTEELNFVSGLEDFRNLKTMPPAYLNQLASSLLAERERKVAGLASAPEVAGRKAYILS
jgi:hypothetical protein